MEILAFLLLLAGLIWLGTKIQFAAQKMDALNRDLSRLERELERLKRRLEEPHAAPPMQPPASAAGTIEDLLIRRPAPSPPTIPTETLSALGQAAPGIPATQPFLTEAIVATAPPFTPSVPPPLPPIIAAMPAMASLPEPAIAFAATAEPEKQPFAINWEQFMGVKLFSWIGGLALFIGVVLIVKYSFEHNLIPPEVRVAFGFLTGIGLMVGGVMMKRKEYAVTSHTLCATGVVILYAVSFACHSFYHFTGAGTTFALMILVTITAFLMAIRMEAQVVAVLGLVGGFLTPPLLSTGVDNALGLFGYIALLDAGLMAVALKRRWHYLILMGAVGTVLMQLGWTAKFYNVEKVFVAMRILLGFNLLFLLAFVVAEKLKQANDWLSSSAMGLPFVTLIFSFYLLGSPELGARPGVVFSFVLGADLCLLALVLLRHSLHQAHLVAGGGAFLMLTAWTLRYLNPELLNWALGLYLLFAALHTVFPVVLQRLRPGATPVWWGHFFPPLALVLVMIPLLKETEVSWLIWPCVLLIDMLAIGLAVLTASLLSIVAVLVLTAGVTAVWIFKIPAELTGLPPLLFIIGGFALFFLVVGIFAEKIILAKIKAAEAAGETGANPEMPSLFGRTAKPDDLLAQIPALAAIMPFLLLIMASVRLPLANPSPVFGLALLLLALLLGVTCLTRIDLLVPVGLGCVLALEFAWHSAHFKVDAALTPLIWHVGFSLVFIVFPFLFRKKFTERTLPWATAALSGPLHFWLVYRTIDFAFPNAYMGVVPAAFAVPMLAGLAYLVRAIPTQHATRNTLLAWFGGSALFFITLIFPIQFERQWITISWALEGLALLWLFHRVPHSGLRVTGVALLLVAFARLTLNPAVLSYHPRSSVPIVNWYLYAYGLVTVCLFLGARLLAPPRNLVLNKNAPPVLYALGTVLAFLLLNIEIADYFSQTGTTLTFEFTGNFARDMTYSIAWALFALGLLLVGISKQLRAVRYSSLGLLGVTLLKLFLHDLSQLAQLYRIGAFIAVAIIAIFASWLYQRFLAAMARKESSEA